MLTSIGVRELSIGALARLEAAPPFRISLPIGTEDLGVLAAGTFWGEAAAKVSKAAKAEQADPLPAILDFKAQLERAGIELLVVPVPPKVVVYPDKTAAGIGENAGEPPPRLDTAHQEFYRLLKEKGVTVLDLTDELMAHRLDAAQLRLVHPDLDHGALDLRPDLGHRLLHVFRIVDQDIPVCKEQNARLAVFPGCVPAA